MHNSFLIIKAFKILILHNYPLHIKGCVCNFWIVFSMFVWDFIAIQKWKVKVKCLSWVTSHKEGSKKLVATSFLLLILFCYIYFTAKNTIFGFWDGQSEAKAVLLYRIITAFDHYLYFAVCWHQLSQYHFDHHHKDYKSN